MVSTRTFELNMDIFCLSQLSIRTTNKTYFKWTQCGHSKISIRTYLYEMSVLSPLEIIRLSIMGGKRRSNISQCSECSVFCVLCVGWLFCVQAAPAVPTVLVFPAVSACSPFGYTDLTSPQALLAKILGKIARFTTWWSFQLFWWLKKGFRCNRYQSYWLFFRSGPLYLDYASVLHSLLPWIILNLNWSVFSFSLLSCQGFRHVYGGESLYESSTFISRAIPH